MENFKLVMKRNWKKIILVVLVIVLIAVLPASVYWLTIDDGTYKEKDWKSTPYVASTYTSDTKITSNGIETNVTAEELWKEMIEKGNNVQKYLDKPEELKRLMDAEIITQYPKIGKGDLDGVIEFKRADTESNVNTLKYVDEETFNSYIQRYNDNGDTIATEYFTIDSDGNVLMAEWSKTTTIVETSGEGGNKSTNVSYNMTTHRIAYKPVVEKYTMPFDYLWALLVIGDNKDFVLELADLVYSSEIVVTGFEDLQESKDSSSTTSEYEVTVQDPVTGQEYIEKRTITTTTTTIVEENTVKIDLTKANTWLIDYQKDYTKKYPYKEVRVKSDPKIQTGENDVNFVTLLKKYSGTKTKILEFDSWLFEILENNPSTANMVDLTKYLLNKVVGYNRFDDNDFNFDQYDDNSFVDASGIYSENILSDYISSWENGAVWNYVNGRSSYTEYVAKYITKDKTQYICYTDSNTSTRNYGYGVCHTGDNGRTYWHVEEYKKNGININSGKYDTIGTSRIDVKIVDDVKLQLLTGIQTSVKKILRQGGILDEMSQAQIDSLTCIMYQYGNIGNFVEAYKEYGNTEALINAAHSKSGKTYFNSNVESNGRSQANWKLFHEGIYQAQGGQILEPDDYVGSGNGNFLSVATNIWREVCTSGKYYVYGGSPTIPVKGPTIDCSSFVTWVLYEYGYKQEFNYQHSTESFYMTNWNKKFGWEEISVGQNENPKSKLKPGDLLVRRGNGIHHITLVVEVTSDGRLFAYDCGNTSANWNKTSGKPVEKTYFLNVNAPGKIIRVK